MKRFLVIGLVFISCTRQTPEPILARVGPKIITLQEFLKRAEFSPELRYQGPESARTAYLLNLFIEEKLAALNAEAMGLDTLATVRRVGEFIEDMALARELYKREVQDKVHLDKAEIDRAVSYQAQTRTIGYLVFNDEKLANTYRERMFAGLAFNEALRAVYGPGVDTTLNRRECKWGYNESGIEETAFSLQPGQISQVIPVEGAYMMMVLQDVKNNVITTEAEHAKRQNFAGRILRLRKEAMISDQFISSFAKEKKLQFNKPLLKITADYFAEKNLSLKIGEINLTPKERTIGAEVFQEAGRYLIGQMEMNLVSFSNDHLTLGQIIEKWRANNFPVDQTSAETCRRSIVRGISLIVRDMLLAQEGRRRGYAKLASIRQEAGIWQDYYMCAALQQQIAEKNSEKKVLWQPYLKQWRAIYSVEIDTALLRRTELTNIQVLALRIGQYNAMVAPPWTYLY